MKAYKITTHCPKKEGRSDMGNKIKKGGQLKLNKIKRVQLMQNKIKTHLLKRKAGLAWQIKFKHSAFKAQLN